MSRRQRRTEAAKASKIQSADDIPMRKAETISQQKKGKTLLELAAERQSSLAPLSQDDISSGNVRYVTVTPEGKTVDASTGEEVVSQTSQRTADEASPLLDTLVMASSLAALHFTLEVLTVHQYAQELHFPPIIRHTMFVAFPTMFFVIHLLHGHVLGLPQAALSAGVQKGLQVAQQMLFLIVANVAGCSLIHLTNDRGYYAVMKNAPSIGTIWVWSVLELGVVGALAGIVGPGIYAWYHGYGIY